MARNYYAQALQIMSRNPDLRNVAVMVAMKHPQVFMEAVEAIENAPVPPTVHDQKLIALIRADRKIEAIKERRAYSHEGLLEAKNYVEALMEKIR